MGWVDTHCHLQLDGRPPEELLARASDVDWVVAPGVDAASSRASLDLSLRFPGRVLATAGLHPHDAEAWPEQRSVIETLAPEVAAIGETGLDFYRNLAPRDAQLEAFTDQIGLARDLDKPVIVHTIYGEEPLAALSPLRAAGVPIYRSLEGSARAMGAVWRHARSRRLPAVEARHSHPDRARVDALLSGHRPGEVLPEPQCRDLLSLYGVAVPHWHLAGSAAETADATDALGGPAAVKLVARGVVHKTDIGGVILGVSGRRAASEAWAAMMAAAERAEAADARVLVTAMLEPGVETVVGVLRDRQFGPVVMFGLGGVLVEALDDVVFRLAPFGPAEAESMLQEVRGRRLFDAVRGRPAVDRAAIADVLVRVSELAADRPEIAELDLNPVILTVRGAAIADARAVIG